MEKKVKVAKIPLCKRCKWLTLYGDTLYCDMANYPSLKKKICKYFSPKEKG